MLDEKFWIWETLEEALRPNIDEISDDDVMRVMKAFAANYKGSDLFWDYLHQRVYRKAATPY